MSILKNNITANRISLLAKTDEKVFHTDDLANLWLIMNKNTLRVTLARYVQNGLLYRLYRGFYSLYPIADLDPVLVGAKSLHQFCYLTTETVLFEEGWINQNIEPCTFVSSTSKKFRIGEHLFVSRKLGTKYLYQSEGIILKNGTQRATVERAIADMLYFNPRYHFDKRVDWRKIKAMQKKIRYSLTPFRYDSPKTN